MSCNWAAGPASMGSLGSSSPQRDCATAGRAPNRWSLDGAPCRNQGSSCGEVATENSSQADVVSEEKAKRKLQFISEKYEELRKLHHEHAAAEARSTEATLNSLKAEARALSGQVDDATGRRHVPPEHRFNRYTVHSLAFNKSTCHQVWRSACRRSVWRLKRSEALPPGVCSWCSQCCDCGKRRTGFRAV